MKCSGTVAVDLVERVAKDCAEDLEIMKTFPIRR
jgi:hypothetical protein